MVIDRDLSIIRFFQENLLFELSRRPARLQQPAPSAAPCVGQRRRPGRLGAAPSPAGERRLGHLPSDPARADLHPRVRRRADGSGRGGPSGQRRFVGGRYIPAFGQSERRAGGRGPIGVAAVGGMGEEVMAGALRAAAVPPASEVH
eukprot:413733-Prorocentrum_minimum.AAC.2